MERSGTRNIYIVDDCQLQIKNYKGAIYKSFTTREEAEHAFATPAYVYLKKKSDSNNTNRKRKKSLKISI